MKGVLRCAIQTFEGTAEENGIRFSGLDLGGGEDMLEKKTDIQTVQNRLEPIVEIGEHCQRSKSAGRFKKSHRLGIELPGGGRGVMLEERIKEGLEHAVLALHFLMNSGFDEDVPDQFAPPGPFSSVARAVALVVGGGSAGKKALKGFLHPVRLDGLPG